MSGDTAILKNGRVASLTEAGWEVHPWSTDKEPLVFRTINEVSAWGNTHDEYGNRITPPHTVGKEQQSDD